MLTILIHCVKILEFYMTVFCKYYTGVFVKTKVLVLCFLNAYIREINVTHKRLKYV